MTELLYPHPRVELYDAHRALYLLGQRQDEFESFRKDAAGWLDAHKVTEPARSLFEALDYPGMVGAGMHPILVLTLERKMQFAGG